MNQQHSAYDNLHSALEELDLARHDLVRRHEGTIDFAGVLEGEIKQMMSELKASEGALSAFDRRLVNEAASHIADTAMTVRAMNPAPGLTTVSLDQERMLLKPFRRQVHNVLEVLRRGG